MAVRPSVFFSGTVYIEPTLTLAEMAMAIGQALGGLVFTVDEGYDEIPAYSVNILGFQLVLLGMPDPEADMRDESEKGDARFILDVEPTFAPDKPFVEVDLSQFLVEMLRPRTGLRCSVE